MNRRTRRTAVACAVVVLAAVGLWSGWQIAAATDPAQQRREDCRAALDAREERPALDRAGDALDGISRLPEECWNVNMHRIHD